MQHVRHACLASCAHARALALVCQAAARQTPHHRFPVVQSAGHAGCNP